MKKLMYIFLLLFIITGCTYKNNDSELHSNNSIETITSVKSTYSIVNDELLSYFQDYFHNNESYVYKQKDITILSSEGCSVESYWDQDTLKVIRLYMYGELGNSQIDYYIVNDSFVFVVELSAFYDKPFYLDGKIIKKHMKKYYIINEEVMVYDITLNELVKLKESNNIYSNFEKIKAELCNLLRLL